MHVHLPAQARNECHGERVFRCYEISMNDIIANKIRGPDFGPLIFGVFPNNFQSRLKHVFFLLSFRCHELCLSVTVTVTCEFLEA